MSSPLPSSSSSTLLQFNPLPTTISPSFWHALTSLKLNHLRLSEDAIPVMGSYTVGRVVKDRRGGEKGRIVELGGSLSLLEEGLGGGAEAPAEGISVGAHFPTSSASSSSRLSVTVRGMLRNYNTAPQFTSADKNEIFSDLAQEILNDLLTSPDPLDAVTRFTVLAFADLKKYKYYHWAALPALIAQPNWQTSSPGWKSLQEEWTGKGEEEGEVSPRRMQSLAEAFKEHWQRYRGESEAGFCLVKVGSEACQVGMVRDFQTFFAGVPNEERVVLFIDPSATPSVPGWPLRNFLALLSVRFQVRQIRVICWRDELDDNAVGERSIIGNVFLPAEEGQSGSRVVKGDGSLPIAATQSDSARPVAIGWERNTQGKLAPKVADLGPLMDPRRLADQAVDLNLKLMRWRIMPEIQLEKIASTKCLLLGAGTLGCYVARVLMGWGVRNITLVDSSRVSYSNPVRQPLFEFEDCLDGGEPKAACAADRLKKIFPGVNAEGIMLSVPMPGHGLFSSSSTSSKVEASTRREVEQLESLIDSHDAVFLLMDSRESRWLPTMLGAAKGKIVINAALGFDTYLVMRHGAGPALEGGSKDEVDRDRLGCYFCNDVVAPSDSLTDRTLDQMCTVTRPGLAAIAGASAVELLVSLVQHPDGVSAPAPTPSTSGTSSSITTSSASSCLGLLPHQLRANLSTFSTLPLTAPAYARCTACSSAVVQAYRTEGWEMLRKALGAEEGYLERLTGLDVMYAETERMLMEDGGVEEWSEGEEEGEGELL
ncbi:E1-like protein-activating [Microstroma glucosiphilum]|uniref:Ubiquitin-like modifier-activating enzyme ATG7 n=1 Tax=Pseudomicrostroma glucosiphilum TaxID=1684307 RepID=A0A316U932_9BASI|nr:E1-like protein-activating [Pseudomicrostroma glucosiphilum]PWN21726.1 E1-like protein-activating [Pseudomicrostroma glucosiphilum]